MNRLLPILLLFVVAASAEAGPLRRRPANCGPVGCGTAIAVDNSSAQAVADANARSGQNAHRGGHYAYEGVGWGTTPGAALAACCDNGRPVVDQGVARSADGRYFACRRYAR